MCIRDRWSRTTKTIVVVGALLLLGALFLRFRTLIIMLVMAAILAYLLDPLISFIDRRTNIRRGLIIAVVYLVLAAALVGGFFALGVASYQQAANLIEQAPALIENSAAALALLANRTEPLTLGPFSLNPDIVPWERLPEELLGMVQPCLLYTSRCV